MAFLDFQALTCDLFSAASMNIRPYLVFSIVTPATLCLWGGAVVPVGLSVRLSSVRFVVVPALLTLSCFCIVPAGLGVALGVAVFIVPATLSLL